MKYHINLLTLKKPNALDRTVFFAMNYLRYILVITQIVVIMVFLYKLKVDQEIIDLQDAVNQKKEIVEIAQPLVSQAKEVDFKLTQIKAVITTQDKILKSLSYLLATFPKDFFLDTLTQENGDILMKGHTTNAPLINVYLNKVQKEKKFISATLDSIQRVDTGYQFTFVFSFLSQKAK
ncbi:hypothetical protein HY214_02665 [Candidatus Roizmanbacteria bacterium]|nr:hypothetical protein [Candidatus Roizmanbacteria bacterium]